jgi:hypothetical protein
LSDAFNWKSPREGVIDARYLAGGVLLVIRAEEARRTTTGLHAKVTIIFAENEGATKGTKVTSDTFNLDKEAQRNDFVTVLYGAPRSTKTPKLSEDFMTAYPRANFERALYDFSEEFYEQLMSVSQGRFVSGDTEKTEPKFLVDGLVLEDGGTVLYAPPKSVKSYLTMLLAVSIDAGVSTYFPVKQARVAYLNLERGESLMTRRLGLVNRVLGLPPERPLLMMNEKGKSLANVYPAAKATVERNEAEVVFLDSLTRGGFGNLNDNEPANQAMDFLNRLAPAWVAIAHTPRQDDTHIFGSQMFDAAMDVGVNIRRQKLPDGTVGIGINVKDTNDFGAPPQMRILAFEFDTFGLTNVRDAHRHEFPEIEETSSPRTNADRIYDQLVAFGKASQQQLADDLRMNPGTVSAETRRLLNEGRIISLPKEGRHLMYGVPAKYEGQP